MIEILVVGLQKTFPRRDRRTGDVEVFILLLSLAVHLMSPSPSMP